MLCFDNPTKGRKLRRIPSNLRHNTRVLQWLNQWCTSPKIEPWWVEEMASQVNHGKSNLAPFILNTLQKPWFFVGDWKTMVLGPGPKTCGWKSRSGDGMTILPISLLYSGQSIVIMLYGHPFRIYIYIIYIYIIYIYISYIYIIYIYIYPIYIIYIYIYIIYIYIYIIYFSNLKLAAIGAIPLYTLTLIPMRSQWGQYNLPRNSYRHYHHSWW